MWRSYDLGGAIDRDDPQLGTCHHQRSGTQNGMAESVREDSSHMGIASQEIVLAQASR